MEAPAARSLLIKHPSLPPPAYSQVLLPRFLIFPGEAVLKPHGVAVIIEATHQCMTTRGVHKHNVSMVTRSLLGVFETNTDKRQELMTLINRPSFTES